MRRLSHVIKIISSYSHNIIKIYNLLPLEWRCLQNKLIEGFGKVKRNQSEV